MNKKSWTILRCIVANISRV